MTDYNNIAKLYAQQTALLEKELRANMQKHFPNLEGKSILDVGCGSGQDAQFYLAKGARVTGIDISEKEVNMAQKLPGNYLVANMEQLPFPENSFDVVASTYALQASSNVIQSMIEMIRVVKPNNPIVIATKHPIRNLLESHVNDCQGNGLTANYFERRIVTSHIFNGSITLREPNHMISEYLSSEVLDQAVLVNLKEYNDFPASAQVVQGMIYPTYMIMKFIKKKNKKFV